MPKAKWPICERADDIECAKQHQKDQAKAQDTRKQKGEKPDSGDCYST